MPFEYIAKVQKIIETAKHFLCFFPSIMHRRDRHNDTPYQRACPCYACKSYYTPVELIGIYRSYFERGKTNNEVCLSAAVIHI